MKSKSEFQEERHVALTVSLIRSKCKQVILHILSLRTWRINELQKKSQKVLTKSLREPEKLYSPRSTMSFPAKWSTVSMQWEKGFFVFYQ